MSLVVRVVHVQLLHVFVRLHLVLIIVLNFSLIFLLLLLLLLLLGAQQVDDFMLVVAAAALDILLARRLSRTAGPLLPRRRLPSSASLPRFLPS